MPTDQGKTKLVVVEGIMGSGKTTTTNLIHERMVLAGIRSRAICEAMDDHPVQTSDPEGFSSVEDWMRERRRRWGDFCQDVARSKEVTVLDGQLYHECVDSLLYYDVPPEEIRAFVGDLDGMTMDAHPILIYFVQSDVGDAIRDVFRMRGDRWSQWQVDWKVHGRPYCRNRGLSGVEGFIELYTVHRLLTDQCFEESSMRKLLIDTQKADWNQHVSRIFRFVSSSVGLDYDFSFDY